MSTLAHPRTSVPDFEITGPPAAPVVVVLGGISAHRHVCANALDASPGWWEPMVGRGRSIDTRRWRVVSFDYVDGGCDASGRPARTVTTHDQADALANILDQLGLHAVHAVVGASYGGMVALAFAERYAERLSALVVIGAAHESHPMTTARRAVQRRIVEMGLDTGRAQQALALARALAVTTYRSASEFAARFPTAAVTRGSATPNETSFPVMEYLDRHGAQFAEEWQPARFLALSLSGDLHAVAPRLVRTPATLVAIADDGIVPPEQVAQLAAQFGGPVRLHTLSATNGHDAFLTATAALGPLVERGLHTPPTIT